MTRIPEIPGSSDESGNLQGQSIAGPTNTADVTADKTPVTTEEQVESESHKDEETQ